MYDCLTAQEETELFLAAMDEYEKHLDVDQEGLNSSNPDLPCNVYTETQVKNNTSNGIDSSIYFIAGRGGETNFHAGNAIFRDRVLQYTHAYVQAGTKGRGKKFARSLMNDKSIAITQNVIFVVRQAYFKKNVDAGKISAPRKNSVLQQHKPRTLNDILYQEKANHYLTIGEEWIVGIITDLLRTSAAKFMGMVHCHKPQQQHAIIMPTSAVPVLAANNNKRKLLLHDPPVPCPEISVPDNAGACMMPLYYQQQQPQQQQPQQYQYQPFQHHEDCSLSSVSYSDEDDYHSMHSSDKSERSRCSSTTVTASNDMFLSLYPQQQPEMMMMVPVPPPQQKRARMATMTMKVTTTTIPAMPTIATTAAAPASPYHHQPADSQQWWHSAPATAAATHAAAVPPPMMMMTTLDQQQQQQQPCWDNVVTPIITLNDNGYNNNNNTYQYGDNLHMHPQQQQPPPVQQQQQFYGYHEEVWRTQAV